MNKEFSLFLCGVGGQGLVLLSNIIGNACVRDQLRVITGEQHGLSQRSGTISIHLRIGAEVRSPLIPVGTADCLLALEAYEALRYIEYLKQGGVVTMNTRIMHPVTETKDLIRDKNREYFGLAEVESRVKKVTPHLFSLDALAIAEAAGNPLTENVVVLGAISILESFPVSMESLKTSIAALVPPKASEVNLRAFESGAKAAHDYFCRDINCKKP